MANVVQQCRQANQQAFLRIELAELRDDAAREVVGPERVFEARMGRAGVDEKRVAELPNVAQALNGRCIEDRQRLRFEADVVPERVANDLV